MAIVIERTITVNNDKSILDSPLYLYVGDGDITYLFTIKEKKKVAAFGELGSSNSLLSEINGYGEVRIYKPDGSEPVFTTRAEIVDDKLQAVFSSEHIDQLDEAGTHQLQIHLYDDDYSVKNRFTIPPIELNVLFPVGTGPNIVGAAEVGYAKAAEEAPIDTFLDDGSYNKTEWETGDKITSGKLNKIEDALYLINEAGEDYITHTELATELTKKANASHTHSEYALKSQVAAIPTKTSQLTNDSGFITSANIPNLSDIPTKTSQLTNDSGFITAASIPTVPTKLSAFNNDVGYMTTVPAEYVTESELSGRKFATQDYVTSAINNAQLGGGSGDGSTPNIDLSIYAIKSDIPTRVSQLTNDSGYVTESVVDNKIANAQINTDSLSDYAKISYVDQQIAAIELTPGPEGPQGPEGPMGPEGPAGKDGTVTFEELTAEQKASLKGEKGDKGDKGDKGADGTVTFESLTNAQKASLKGEQGPAGKDGVDGKDFTYDMFTEEQLAALVGPKGDKGDSFTYTDMTAENKADLTQGFITCSNNVTRIEIVEQLPETEEPGVLYMVIKK